MHGDGSLCPLAVRGYSPMVESSTKVYASRARADRAHAAHLATAAAPDTKAKEVPNVAVRQRTVHLPGA